MCSFPTDTRRNRKLSVIGLYAVHYTSVPIKQDIWNNSIDFYAVQYIILD